MGPLWSSPMRSRRGWPIALALGTRKSGIGRLLFPSPRILDLFRISFAPDLHCHLFPFEFGARFGVFCWIFVCLFTFALHPPGTPIWGSCCSDLGFWVYGFQKWRRRKGKRASRHNGDNKDNKKLVSRSVRAELQFPVSHIHQ